MIALSPRMQGTALHVAYREKALRFIPAYAGNGRLRWWFAPMRPVHPRVCRELSRRTETRTSMAGSSPRMQGTAENTQPNPPAFRFIPAYAGNGSRAAVIPASSSVHPRVCRERSHGALGSVTGAGSSPRMQGTVDFTASEEAALRFIPAYAGNGPDGQREIPGRPIHPRVCRER